MKFDIYFYKKWHTYLIVLLTGVYALNRHFVRPYIRTTYPDLTTVRVILNSLPNFLGSIILYIFITRILKGYNGLKASLFIVVYSVLHETVNVWLDGIKFDWNDIIASLLAVIVSQLIDVFILKKTEVYSK
ncbi:hypothetical protein [Sphingobacterium yanglingense]|uniref:VanZ like protein n=1 Tax=Sphingobacterium yanglingense TaxID=1437280 RepID=A0A4R6WDN7_9SPHI|nr:hypothetical protein [Sphingobacterium yanglingense]TDQ75929.1 hypothetical protein CLV99_3624 [Sphingobacterium yanglingense]